MNHNVILLGTRKGLLMLERRPNGWQIARTAFAGAPVAFAMEDPRTGTFWATLDHGHWGQKLHRSRDRGVTWDEVTSPKYPEGAELGDGTAASLRYLWVLAPGGADQPGRIYAGTEPGALFVSDDDGENFSMVESLWNHESRKTAWFGGGRDQPGIHSIIVDPRDSKHVQIGISCAGVFETTDGGASWAPCNKGLKATFLPNPDAEVGHDPHFVDFCLADPDVLWQQNHCGVFRSANGGESWDAVHEEGGPVDFGFAIAADQNDPNTAWVVPAENDDKRMAHSGSVMVGRTEDAGKTWTHLRNGLPQENCYDIVYRHALANSGDTLAFGSTTGNAWVSENRGDNWSTLGNYLPPIYSVRFATEL